MGVNKVVYGDTTLIDLTACTVDAEHLMAGYTAYDKSGNLITGTAAGGGGVFWVTFDYSTNTVDHSASEIYAAYQEGQVPILKDGNTGPSVVMLESCSTDSCTFACTVGSDYEVSTWSYEVSGTACTERYYCLNKY